MFTRRTKHIMRLTMLFITIEFYFYFLLKVITDIGEYNGIVIRGNELRSLEFLTCCQFIALEVVCTWITYIAGSATVMCCMICAPSAVGFTKTGIRYGSYASKFQYYYKGYIPRGCIFQKAHRLGMTMHKKLTKSTIWRLYVAGLVIVFFLRAIYIH